MYIFQILLFVQAIITVLLQEDVAPATRHPAYISEREVTLDSGDDSGLSKNGDTQPRAVESYSSEYDEYSDDEDGYSSFSDSKSRRQGSIDGSSLDAKEKGSQFRLYRTCTACPREMVKSYNNNGIKWLCAGYQRARRTFKSECTMRYRNCQDGTLFVKLYDHKCKDDYFHGRHFFYHYKT